MTGGISTVIARLASEFFKNDHDVTIFVADRDNFLRQIEVVGDVPVYGMYLRAPISPQHFLRGVIMCWTSFPLTMGQLLWLTWWKKLDAIILQYPLPNMFYFGVLKCFSGVKLVITYQGNDAHDLHSWSSQERGLVKYLLGKADAVVAVSRTLLEKVTRVFPDLHLKRIEILPNGAPLDVVHQVEPTELEGKLLSRYVFTAGHLIYRKGIDLMIAAVRIAKDSGVIMHLVVAGEGADRDDLLRLAHESGVSNQVIFLGEQSQAQVLGLMKSCLFFVLASRAEGMPLVIAEAMACGKAVVATRVDGVPEIVQDGMTGILVPAEDTKSLAAAMVRMYSDTSYREALARQGKEWAGREYNWESIARRYLCLIEDPKIA